MKKTMLVVFLAIAPSLANAEVLKKLDDLLPFSASVMEKVSTGNMRAALDSIKAYMTTPEEQVEAVFLQSQSARKQAANLIGETIGYEFLGQKSVGTSLFRAVYLEKTDKLPITWTFIYYRNNEGWTLVSFKFELDSAVPFFHEHD